MPREVQKMRLTDIQDISNIPLSLMHHPIPGHLADFRLVLQNPAFRQIIWCSNALL